MNGAVVEANPSVQTPVSAQCSTYHCESESNIKHSYFRLRKARVLLAGMSSLGNEVCKNILLAGIKHLTILDDKDMTKTDFDAQFFSSEEDVGKNVSFIEFTLNRAKKNLHNVKYRLKVFF